MFDNETYDTDGFSYRKDLPPGTASWAINSKNETASLIFTCPSGCGRIENVPIANSEQKGWTWDGNVQAPTLQPSIQIISGCKWHGYLIKGEWLTA